MTPTTQQNTGHTAGPWRIEDTRKGADFTVVPQWQKGLTKRKPWEGDYYPICNVSRSFVRVHTEGKKAVFNHPELPEALANARLIAAAPTLLEACQAVLRGLELSPIKGMETDAELLRSAIAKATGQH